MNKEIKTILLSSVILTLIIGVSNFDSAFAETDKELRDIAKNAKDIEDKKIKKDKEGKKSEAKQLEKEHKKLIKKLNDHGLATFEQFEQNPEYWLEKRANYLFPEQAETNSIGNGLGDNFATSSSNNNFAEAHAHCACGEKALKYMAGYKVPFWGIWWVSYAEEGWTYALDDEWTTSDVTVSSDDNGFTATAIHLARGNNAPVTISWGGEYYLTNVLGDVQQSGNDSFTKYFSNGFVSHSIDWGSHVVYTNWEVEMQFTPSSIS